MSDENLPAYLATALTGLDDGERAEVFNNSELIARTCNRFGISIYQPKEHTDPVRHADKPPREVYLTDRERVATSDIVLALCTHPSCGVGAENEIAAGAIVPVVYLVPRGRKLSKMLSGSLAENRIVEYVDSTDLEKQLSAVLAELRPMMLQNRERYQGSDGATLATRLRELREWSGLTVEQLASKSGVPPARIQSFETKDEAVAAPTVNHLRRVSEALGVPPSCLLGEFSPAAQDPVEYKSLLALKVFARNRTLSYPVYEALWDEYKRSRTEIGFVSKTRNSAALTEADWEDRHARFLDRGRQRELELLP